MCRDNVEAMYYIFSGRGTYDIRHPSLDPEPPTYFVDYLNQAYVQEAIGVNLNYTKSNYMIYNAFQQSGDMIYRTFIDHLGSVIDSGVRVVLYYGDADYIVSSKSSLKRTRKQESNPSNSAIGLAGRLFHSQSTTRPLSSLQMLAMYRSTLTALSTAKCARLVTLHS